MNLTDYFKIAVPALGMLLTGCSNNEDPYGEQTVVSQEGEYGLEMIYEGQEFVDKLPKGAGVITVPAEKLGCDKDLKILYSKSIRRFAQIKLNDAKCEGPTPTDP